MQIAASGCVHAHALDQIEHRAVRPRRRGERGAMRRPYLQRCRLSSSISWPRTATPALELDALAAEGLPLLVPVDCLEEDPDNPRTEFPDEEVAELAWDIAARGILQPIVVRRALRARRYRTFSAPSAGVQPNGRRGLWRVPVVIGSEAHDVYVRVAENQKRHGLTPLDLAGFHALARGGRRTPTRTPPSGWRSTG